MSDFLLDFRNGPDRYATAQKAADSFTWCPDSRTQIIDKGLFSLVLAGVDDQRLWGPCEVDSADGTVFVALAGRIVLNDEDWESSTKSDNRGGVVCKALLAKYLQQGLDFIPTLNGNFAVFIYDGRSSTFHLATDRAGMLLSYGPTAFEKTPVLGSHPDVLASTLGEEQNLDMVSLAEFVTTGRLTPPHTYYRGVQALESGTLYTIDLSSQSRILQGKRYFDFRFRIAPDSQEESLAEELAVAFRSAVRKRSHFRLGKTAVALSGGLDSRAILSAATSGSELCAFTLYDQPNLESRTAQALAQAAGVPFTAVQRPEDYYVRSAELGVAISGGTGNIASNHFLGVRSRLADMGIKNLLTGCYCDYLLKGLSLNTQERKLSRKEQISGFSFQHYHRHYQGRTLLRTQVVSRLEERFPESRQPIFSEEDWLNVEHKRAFPLAYEGDLAQRAIPQRVIPWFVPMADNAILDVYLKIPSRLKLNSSLFRRMVQIVCDKKLAALPDSNTGAPIQSSAISFCCHRYVSALRNRLNRRFHRGLATRGSWPNWRFLIGNSPQMRELWLRPNDYAVDISMRLFGHNPFASFPISPSDGDIEHSLRLFTLKLWLDQRAGSRFSFNDC